MYNVTKMIKVARMNYKIIKFVKVDSKVTIENRWF